MPAKPPMKQVCRPAPFNMAGRLVALSCVRNPRDAPSSRMSPAVPPCPIRPVWIPNRPVISAVRDGAQGASEQ
jgi:hypothetical protein